MHTRRSQTDSPETYILPFLLPSFQVFLLETRFRPIILLCRDPLMTDIMSRARSQDTHPSARIMAGWLAGRPTNRIHRLDRSTHGLAIDHRHVTPYVTSIWRRLLRSTYSILSVFNYSRRCLASVSSQVWALDASLRVL
jgi:hypothetical protein